VLCTSANDEQDLNENKFTMDKLIKVTTKRRGICIIHLYIIIPWLLALDLFQLGDSESSAMVRACGRSAATARAGELGGGEDQWCDGEG